MSTTIPSTTPSNSPATTGAASQASAQLSLSPTDFLNMMVTQLKNQDPLKPTSSSDLLAQMSQIGQLQSSTSLQSTLQNFGNQTSLTSAASMIGKSVIGTDANSKPQTGVVTSVQIAGGNVSLELDNGTTMPLANVTTVAPGPTAAPSTNGSTSTPSVGG